MPELGKATYLLVFDTQQGETAVTGLETRADAAGQSIAQSMGMAEKSVVSLGDSTQTAEGQLSIFGTEGAAAMEKTGAAATVMAGEVKAAAATLATTTEAATARAGAAVTGLRARFMKFGKIGGSGLGIAGAFAGYMFFKGGLNYLKSEQAALLQVNNAVSNTGRLTGVTVGHVKALAQAFVGVHSQTYATNLQTASLLARFTNLRNEGAGAAAIYDRAYSVVQDVIAATGRSSTMVAIGIGKALQDPVKNYLALSRAGVTFNAQQKAMLSTLIKTKGPLAAQKYLLSQIEQRYGGAARANLKSFSAQWTQFKDVLDRIAAGVLTSLIPAFAHLAGFFQRYPGILKAIVYTLLALGAAWVTVKIAAVAYNTAMGLMNFVKWIGRLGQVEAGAKGVGKGFIKAGTEAAVGATETVVATGEMDAAVVGTEASVGLLAAAWPLMAAAAVAAIYEIIQHIGPLKRATDWLGNEIGKGLYWLGTKLGITSGGPSGPIPTQADAGRIKRMYDADIKRGMSPTQAMADVSKRTGFSAYDVNVISGNAAKNAPSASRTGSHAKPLNSGSFTTNPVTSANVIPVRLQAAFNRAKQSSNLSAELKALHAEQAYLMHELKQKGLSSKTMLAASNALTRVDDAILAIEKKGAVSRAKAAKDRVKALESIPLRLQLAVANALKTKSLKDDKKALTAEEDYLKGLLKNRKLSLAERLKITQELDTVLAKLAGVNKKMGGALSMSQKQMEAFIEARGTFFSQFASSIFGGSGNHLSMGVDNGSSQHNVTVNQNNNYADAPNDRYRSAKVMRDAAVAAMN